MPAEIIAIEQLCFGAWTKTQLRAPGNKDRADHVNTIADAITRGEPIEPIVVFREPGKKHVWIGDGFHRVDAHKKVGKTEISCDVRTGDFHAAMKHAIGANARHGLRRTRQDIRRVIRAALEHPDLKGLSDVKIAEHVGCTDKTVAAERERTRLGNSEPRTPTRRSPGVRLLAIAEKARNATTKQLTAARKDEYEPTEADRESTRRALEMLDDVSRKLREFVGE